MATAASNHIRYNFEARLVQYVILRYGYTRPDAQKLVTRLKNVNTHHMDDEIDLLAWLELRPTAANIKSHLVLFLGKVYDILEFTEPLVRGDDVPKGCRLFSLLPQPTTCIPAYYSVETSHLYQIAKDIIRSHDEDIFNLCTAIDDQGRKRYATSAEFITVRERMWETVFDLSRCVSSEGNPDIDRRIGKGRRKFEYMIRTNGYAVCILTSIPRELQRTVQPGLYKPHTLIGVDPGERMPLTCYSRPVPGTYVNLPDEPCPMPGWCNVCYEHNGGKRHGKKRRRGHRRRQRRRKRRSQAVCDVVGWCDICHKIQPELRPRKHDVRRRTHFLREGAHVFQTSSAEYRHMARIEHHAHWFQNLKKRHMGYGEFVNNMLSLKTTSSALLLEGYKYMWQHMDDILLFCASMGFRKWRFTMSRFKRQAVCKLAKRIVPTIDRGVCVCLGNWNQHKGVSGYMNAPIKRLTAELSRRATLISVDEFRTSRLCSGCFTPMVGMPFADPELDEAKPSRNVRLCMNILCGARCWERDVNAAKNMWQLGLQQVTGRPRPWQFLRGRRLN